MATFNISSSKIEQLNNSGNNNKQTSKDGSNAISEQGSIVQAEGAANKVEVNKPKESLMASVWGKLKSLWTGISS